jgi:hypothetical protein
VCAVESNGVRMVLDFVGFSNESWFKGEDTPEISNLVCTTAIPHFGVHEVKTWCAFRLPLF